MSDFEKERRRLRTFRSLPDRQGNPGQAVMVGKVVSPASKIAVGSFLLVNPVTVLGTEVEGATGLNRIDTGISVPVYLVGPGLPAPGDMLICRSIDYRWAADCGKVATTQGQTLLGCTCANIPNTITMHVQNQPNNGLESLVFTATLVWQPKPASLATYRSDDPGYYGTADLVSSNGTYKFRYWFGCSGSTYFVRAMITPDSPTGFPGDLVIMNFLPGFPGNTCVPFSLHNGSTQNPVFKYQVITVDAAGGP